MREKAVASVIEAKAFLWHGHFEGVPRYIVRKVKCNACVNNMIR